VDELLAKTHLQKSVKSHVKKKRVGLLSSEAGKHDFLTIFEVTV
jgi:hypothetical protein